MSWTRRTFLRAGAALAGSACAPVIRDAAPTRPYLDAARGAVTWLRAHAIRTDAGLSWHTGASPRDTQPTEINLYHGTSGIVMFLLAMHDVTGDASLLRDARQTADDLLARTAALRAAPARDGLAPELCGLYGSLPGAALALAAVARATGDARYREAAVAITRDVRDAARPAGDGVAWNAAYDASYGIASTALFLLHAARTFAPADLAPSLVDVATRGGRRLIEVASRVGDGLDWPIGSDTALRMPNFGHGTAGIGYVLATLFRHTREPAFRDAAVRAGTYLRSVAHTDGNVFLVFHADPGGLDRYYLSWCHGPPGTGRFLYRLAQVTADPVWMRLLEASARGAMTSGIPARTTSGFWNNVGQCCGSAGVADFMLGLHRITGRAEYLAFARTMMDDVLRRATHHADGGLSWTHAEHRVRPAELSTQTGYMQGAAGVGAAFARLDAVLHDRAWPYVPIDSPFPG